MQGEGDGHPVRRRRRALTWVVGALVVLVTTAVAVLLTGLVDGSEQGTSGDGPDGVDVEVIDASGVRIRGPVLPAGRHLVTVIDRDGVSRVARSGDRGRSWDVVELPEAPGNVLIELRTVAGLLVATAAADSRHGPGFGSYDGYVWVSERGDEWSGGLAVEATPDVSFGYVGGLDDGLVTATTSSSGDLVVLTSRDQGRSWETTSVPGVRAAPDESISLREAWTTEGGTHRMRLQSFGVSGTGERGDHLIESVDGGSTWRSAGFCPTSAPSEEPEEPCRSVVQVGRLRLRGLETSVDGGGTWAPVRLEVPEGAVAWFDSAVELPGGGWLATVRGQVLGGGGALAWVLRSDDGIGWTALLGPGIHGCPDSAVDTDEPVFAASPPVTATDGPTYVSFTCPARPGGRSVLAVLASLGGDARSVDILHEAEANHQLLDPVRLGDHVLVPVVSNDERRLVQTIEVPPPTPAD